MSDTIISTIRKNKKEELRVSLDQFSGHDLFSARVFFEAEDGSMRPGKGGVAFRVALLPEFAEAVIKALGEAKKRGLL